MLKVEFYIDFYLASNTPVCCPIIVNYSWPEIFFKKCKNRKQIVN